MEGRRGVTHFPHIIRQKNQKHILMHLNDLRLFVKVEMLITKKKKNHLKLLIKFPFGQGDT